MSELANEQWRMLEDEHGSVIDECKKAALMAAYDVFRAPSSEPKAIQVLKAFSAANAAAQKVNKAWSIKSGRIITLLGMEAHLKDDVADALWASINRVGDILNFERWKSNGVYWSAYSNALEKFEVFSEFRNRFEECSFHELEDDENSHVVDDLLLLSGLSQDNSLHTISTTEFTSKLVHEARDEAWETQEIQRLYEEAEENAFQVAIGVFGRHGTALDAFLEVHHLEKEINDRLRLTHTPDVDPNRPCIHLSRSEPLDQLSDGVRHPLETPHFWLSRCDLIASAYWAFLENIPYPKLTPSLRKIGKDWTGFVTAFVALRYFYKFRGAFCGSGLNGFDAVKFNKTIEAVDLKY